MSKIPIDKNGLIRNKETRGMFFSTPNRMNNVGLSPAENNQLNTIKKPVYCTSYASLIPKMKEDMDEVTKQNPRILDLRLKLNEISKKQDRSVDKETKSLINGITQRLEEKEQDESGPYSLIFELQNNASTSQHEDKDCVDGNVWTKSDNDAFNGKETSAHCYADSESLKNIVDRLPNVIRIDDKPMKEFEYSCETESNLPVKKPYHTQSRSELCLNFKSYASPRPFDPNASPNENSISRANEENSLDDSLGILTPDQMDDICFLENAFSPTVEGLPSFCDKNDSKASPDTGDTPSTDKTESHSAASTIQNDGFDNNECMNSGFPEEAIIPSVTLQMENDETQVVFMKASIQKSIPTVDNNEDITDKNAIEPIKEEVLPSFMEDDFMPSIHSSILEPASSIAGTTVNLDLPLDCKTNDIRLSVSPQRIEQTPSPEDLPLDSCDIQTEVSTYSNSQYSVSILQDSQTFSDVKNDFPKSMETSKVSNSFITSITSITSLDGYQGDGEMSRPVSRGADHSIGAREEVAEMDWQNVPVTRRADPMTDSDFFTESDADGLDDNVQRGDRRAQVIDGALYGGKNGNGNPPLIVNRNEDSCMESSGVYTDFETHRTSPIFLNVIDDMSPEGSTPSTHSECSQKNVNTSQTLPGFLPALDETLKGKYSPKLSEDTPKSGSKRNSINSEKDSKFNDKLPKEEKRFTLKKYKMPKRDVPSKLKTMLNSRKNDADSSLQSSPKVLKKNERRESLSKKNSIEAKSDFKTKSFKDVKSKVDCSFSLQRSQTTCSVTRMLSSKSSTNAKPKSRHMRMRMELGSAHGSGKSSLHSSQSDLSASSTPLGKVPSNRFPLLRNGKKRDSLPAPATPARAPPAPPPAVAPAKKNGVVQKLAASPVAVRARAPPAPPASPRKTPPRRTPAQRPTTLPTNNKEPARVSPAVVGRGKRVATPPTTRASPAPAPAPPALAPAPPRATPEQAATLAHAAKGVEALGVLVQYLMFRVDALNSDHWRVEAGRWRGVAAAERAAAARADRDRQQRAQKDLDTIAECLGKISELEMEVSAKEEAGARLQAAHVEEVSALAQDIKDLKETIDNLKREVGESRARLHAHGEIERTLRAQLEAARAELADRSPDQSCNSTLESYNRSLDQSCNTSCECSGSYNVKSNTSDAACDPVCYEIEECELRLKASEELSSDANELAAEVRSLRAVVELKQAEIASLQRARSEVITERELRTAAERDARNARQAAEELKERAAARQRDVDRLRDDNRRLRDAAARDRDHAARLAALNEELRYKLRQKSQVVSLLAGGGYIERSSMRARTESCDSARSPSPPPDSPPSPAASPAPDTPPLPAVKGVVEKHDSVSWVLEIEETPEEVATRLARRSSFRTAASSPSGVKRRGGGSPPSPAPSSPAPTSKLFRPTDLEFNPPPLKESAGEAIYIYDDRQY